MSLTMTGSPISRCDREWLRSSTVGGEVYWYNHIKDVFPSLEVLELSPFLHFLLTKMENLALKPSFKNG